MLFVLREADGFVYDNVSEELLRVAASLSHCLTVTARTQASMAGSSKMSGMSHPCCVQVVVIHSLRSSPAACILCVIVATDKKLCVR